MFIQYKITFQSPSEGGRHLYVVTLSWTHLVKLIIDVTNQLG